MNAVAGFGHSHQASLKSTCCASIPFVYLPSETEASLFTSDHTPANDELGEWLDENPTAATRFASTFL